MALVAISLILLTAYFGESPSSPLHGVQRGIVEVLSPVQAGASKVLSPVRDVAGWFSGTFKAKSQRDKLQKEVQTLRLQNAHLQQASIDNAQLRNEVGLDNSNGISSYQPVGAHVIGRDPTLWYATIQVDKGSSDGVHVDDPVLGDGALVGKVSTVAPNVSVVRLLTDHLFGVIAAVQDARGDSGPLVPKVGDPNQLLLQELPKPASGQPGPQVGQQVVTAGYRSPSGSLTSLYPPGIPIGQVSNANQNDLLNNGQVQVRPAADLRQLVAVQILTRPHAASQLAQVPGG